MTGYWEAVPGWEGLYEVSDEGQVRSLQRIVQSRHNWHVARRLVPERILKPVPQSGGYLRIKLARDGERISAQVHRLVLEAFVGPCPAGMECLHRNGDPTDNRLSNLHWGTARQNQQDRRRHGRRVGPVPGDFCRNGHEYAVTGVVVIQGSRRCLACRLEWRQRSRAAAGR